MNKKYNTEFELSLEDMDLIEAALRRKIATRHQSEVLAKDESLVERVNCLLGRLHNQKTFFRPRTGPYLGG